MAAKTSTSYKHEPHYMYSKNHTVIIHADQNNLSEERKTTTKSVTEL